MDPKGMEDLTMDPKGNPADHMEDLTMDPKGKTITTNRNTREIVAGKNRKVTCGQLGVNLANIVSLVTGVMDAEITSSKIAAYLTPNAIGIETTILTAKDHRKSISMINTKVIT